MDGVGVSSVFHSGPCFGSSVFRVTEGNSKFNEQCNKYIELTNILKSNCSFPFCALGFEVPPPLGLRKSMGLGMVGR
jgi:hypothetical protein